MTIAVTVWLVLTVLLGVVTTLAIWSRGYSRARSLSVVAFLVASPLAAVALGVALGRPVPLIENITIFEGKYQIIGVKMEPKVAIYLYVDGGGEPRSYALPWDDRKAEAIQNALETAGQDGSAGLEVGKFKWPWEGEEGSGEGSGRPEGESEGEGTGQGTGGMFEWSWDQNELRFWGTPPEAPAPKPPVTPGLNFGG